MTTVKVTASVSYDVIIGRGLLDRCGELSASVVAPSRACIVTDDNVAPLYLQRAEDSLRRAGFDTVSFIFPNGEASKSISTLVELLEFLGENRLSRSDCLFALGGGVVGDMCGFAAAVYLRGIKFIQLPTTLLAAVDSSVGGKTAVDLSSGKNLAGAFHQPSLVICDCDTLSTLTERVFSDGCAEIIKYGVINDRAFFEKLKKGIRPQLEEIIADCVRNKRDVVEADEFDNGSRQLLNLGHTVGHAIEHCSNFSISHGSAVAIGMVTVMKAAIAHGLCPAEELSALIDVLVSERLPISCNFSAEELYRAAISDKKRSGNTITLAVPYSIGDTRLLKYPIDELCAFIEKGL